ncbi:L,D-transpeptidase [Streptomyces bottropensis]|uniref:L,D-transpeptidase n=1 Tax=Streptomyces bottropensis TaxID=42235 RepID=UPI0036B95528
MSDELTVRLRELAETAEVPPPGSGAEVRSTAGRRRRRRRTSAAVAGGCAAAGLAAVLTLNAASHGTQQRPPTAASDVPSASAAPEAVVDLSRHVLTFAGRELPISAGKERTPTPTGVMTVTGKHATVVATGETVRLGSDYDLKLSWALTLSPVEDAGPRTGEARGTVEATDGTEPSGSADERTTLSPSWGEGVWIAAIAHNESAPGSLDTTDGWIGLRTADARWLYERMPEGGVVEIRGVGATPSPSASPPSG